jgi:multicomponent Na+:H+ antiporter subunit B
MVAGLTGLPGDRAALPAIARTAVRDALVTWHNPESVSALVYGWRAGDTFGETFLLFAAVVSVLVVTRAHERRHAFLQEERMARAERGDDAESESGDAAVERAERGEGTDTPQPSRIGDRTPERQPQMTAVARGAARVVLPLLIAAGVAVFVQGYTPGGGFVGGAVLTGVALLAYTAVGYRVVRPVLRPDILEIGELVGGALVVGLGVAGLVRRHHLFANPLPLGGANTIFGGGLLQAFSVAELIEVGTGLTIVVFSMLAMADEWTAGDDEHDGGAGGARSDVASAGDGGR